MLRRLKDIPGFSTVGEDSCDLDVAECAGNGEEMLGDETDPGVENLGVLGMIAALCVYTEIVKSVNVKDDLPLYPWISCTKMAVRKRKKMEQRMAKTLAEDAHAHALPVTKEGKGRRLEGHTHSHTLTQADDAVKQVGLAGEQR